MYSSSYSNRDTSFSFCNYNLENHSNPSEEHHYHSHHLYRLHNIRLEHEPDHQLFQQQRPVIASHEHLTRKTTNLQSTMEKSSYNNGIYATAHLNSHLILQNNSLLRKKASKKDRHSKINTAQGPRDRRIRLSLDVAKKFFRLQDMLGFDKASSTIKWLLMKSKPAIQDLPSSCSNLINGVPLSSSSASSASECEVMSGTDDQSLTVVENARSASFSGNKEKKKLDRSVRKSAYIHNSLAKETREQARERARKRTSEKRNNKLCGVVDASGVSGSDQYCKFRPRFDQVMMMDQNVNRLGSWIPFGENQVQTSDQAEYPNHFKQGVVGDNSSAMPNCNWSPSFLFNYQHNPVPSHEHHQFNDFSILSKPWERNDN